MRLGAYSADPQLCPWKKPVHGIALVVMILEREFALELTWRKIRFLFMSNRTHSSLS